MTGQGEALWVVDSDAAIEQWPVKALISKTGKTEHYRLVYRGIDAFAKRLSIDSDFWRQKFQNEIRFYLEKSDDFPVRTPELLNTDAGSQWIVLSWVSGQILSPDRYPQLLSSNPTLDYQIFEKLAGAVDHIAAVPILDDNASHPDNKLEEIKDRIEKYMQELGLQDLVASSAYKIIDQVAKRSRPLSMAHGDMTPSNILVDDSDKETILLDWEYWGPQLAGHDFAFMRLWSRFLPSFGTQIMHTAVVEEQFDEFSLSLLLLSLRELKIHNEEQETPDIARIKKGLMADIEGVVRYLPNHAPLFLKLEDGRC